ncbi:hypothetical protein [Chroogloeocystis siderophila]|jgi:uncharacterized phage infection (PIP) family protein YhgE|uniref:Uncharacterized protein n=1 Tax=Chroogloeocystis siderophila 5.2 s.c.1 TaxID=247279 RepID=A0A1U7HCQ1_9CHRO|nr:hypothetical protein [Chroogloeocystis siderophila]OKH21382.1 hypothetical protein NIES1031_21845 [Chroogloeocystis siderophila 5.2 s.c.1]
MNLQKLKATVYEIAAVSTIKQLKTKYEVLKSLDMRCKASWEQALAIVQQHQTKFTSWLENPPDEYKELFAEIDQVAGSYDNELALLKQKQQVMMSVADDLQALAAEIQDEGDRLKYEARQIPQQADWN